MYKVLFTYIFLEFIGAIVILVYGVEESDVLIKDLKEVFFKLIYRMDWDERANRILKIVQEYVSFRYLDSLDITYVIRTLKSIDYRKK